MKFIIETEDITKEQANKLYNYLVYLQNNLIPIKFEEVVE